MVTLEQAKEIFGELFQAYADKVGDQTVLDVLNENDMDETTARAALNGSINSMDEVENEEGLMNGSGDGAEEDDDDDDDDEDYGSRRPRRSKRKAVKKIRQEFTEKPSSSRVVKKKSIKTDSKTSDVNSQGESMPPKETRIAVTKEEALELEICRLEQELMAGREEEESEDEEDDTLWTPPKWCVPIRADVRNFDFDALAKAQKELTGRLFDVIVTDPPWQLATSNPTRGVALGYEQLSDNFIRDMPFAKLQDNGFLFMWVINAKYRFALSLFELWGYELVDEITWVKQTVNRRLAKSHGFYLQHAKETCLVGRKGNDPPGTNRSMAGGDVIFSERRGQSQKPTEIYETIERLVPGGYYLEIFGRRNNTRDGFLTIGNEL